jgi:hypothetical protein
MIHRLSCYDHLTSTPLPSGLSITQNSTKHSFPNFFLCISFSMSQLSFAAAYHSSQVFSLLSIIFLALNLLLLFIFCSLSRIMKPVDRPRVVLERSHSTFKYLCVHPPTEAFYRALESTFDNWIQFQFCLAVSGDLT